MKRATFIFILSVSFLLICSCSKPIKEYQAKNNDKNKIIDLLVKYTEAVKTGDSEKIVLLFHENGVYVPASGDRLSRDEMLKWNPADWQAYGIRKLYDPEITFNGNEAKVFAKVKYGNVSYAGIFTLIKENNEWLIMRRE